MTSHLMDALRSDRIAVAYVSWFLAYGEQKVWS